MKKASNEQGQFIVIAALMISILIISVSAIMYGTVTYFRHERWEEYLSLIDTLKIGSQRVVEISLANYTLNLSSTVLRDNLNKWRINLTKAYSGFGVVLNPQLANGSYQAYALNITYTLGLSLNWYSNVSFSAANVTIEMNITSIGLRGYKFISTPFLKAEILSAKYDISDESITINMTIDKEGLKPITNLPTSSFSLLANISGQWVSIDLSRPPSYYYDTSLNRFIYELYSDDDDLSSQPSAISVAVIETRNIKVVANSTVSTQP